MSSKSAYDTEDWTGNSAAHHRNKLCFKIYSNRVILKSKNISQHYSVLLYSQVEHSINCIRCIIHVLGVNIMCWSSDMVKVIFVHFSDTVFFNISKTPSDQHYDISMSQIHHPCIQIEPSRDQGYLNMTISLPLSESEVLYDDGSGVCRGKVETVNGTTDHINTFLKSHFWHPQLETQPAWETLHVINISLMHSSAYNSFAKKAGEKAGIPLTTKVINLYLNEIAIILRE